MPEQLVQLKLSVPVRLVIILTILLSLLASWFVVRWYIGNTMADYFNLDESRADTVQWAVALAPNDPLTHWRLGDLIQNKLSPDQINRAVSEYEKAASLSPHDYRFWMVLGQALEQSGETERAEKALREAVRLAPAYAYPHWYLGNLLLRTGNYSEAFAELRQASEANAELQQQLFNFAWQLNKDDFEALRTAIGNSPATRAKFSEYLFSRDRIDEGLWLWNTLSDIEKRDNRSAADAIVATLIVAKRYHKAVEIWNSVAPGTAYRADIGRIVDPGFEDDVSHGPGMLFGWQVPTMDHVQIGITPNVGHTGGRSLRIFFQVRSNLKPFSIGQLVPVSPNTQYDFVCYLKTEKLIGASTPFVTIVDAADDNSLATSEMAAAGDIDWQPISLSFKTGPKTEAVKLLIGRNPCGTESPVCPIFGTVWYDDFNIKPRK
jgi:tetratricopeptide (TPR) repeat protein